MIGVSVGVPESSALKYIGTAAWSWRYSMRKDRPSAGRKSTVAVPEPTQGTGQEMGVASPSALSAVHW